MLFAFIMAISARNAALNNVSFNPHVSDFIAPIVLGGLSFLASLTTFVWMYQVGTKLQAFMHPEMRRLKVQRFKFFFAFPMVYMIIVLSLFVPFIVNTASSPGQQIQNIGSFFAIFILMFIGHFFTFFCIIFSMYFLAKTLKSAELKREAHFSDYIGDFFLFWFFPVGVWFIQPKVNRIISGEINTQPFSNRQTIDF